MKKLLVALAFLVLYPLRCCWSVPWYPASLRCLLRRSCLLRGFLPIVNAGELAALYSFVFLYLAAKPCCDDRLNPPPLCSTLW